jgi:hypothetical protein
MVESVAPRAIGRVEDSESLLRAIRSRVLELGLTHENLDELIGWAGGYSGKLLNSPPTRRLGHFSLFLLLQALGLSLILVEDNAILERLKNRRIPRQRRPVLRAPRIICLPPDFLRRIGRLGGLARAKKLSPKRLSQLGRRMNRIRWGKPRRNGQAAAADVSPPLVSS